MIYELPLPENFRLDVDDAGTIEHWIQSQGCSTDSVSILSNEEGELSILIDCHSDPTHYLENFPRTVTPQEELAEALDDLDLENASVEELKTAVILLRALTKQ